MDKVAFNAQMQDMLSMDAVDAKAVLKLIVAQLAEDAKSAVRAFVALTEEVVKQKNLAGAVACVATYAEHGAALSGIDLPQMREVVRRAATTADEKLLVDSIGLNTAIASAIVKRLTVLMALKPGVYVSSQSWGFGQVKSVDTFYGKVIIDFTAKMGHAMSLTVAGQNLTIAEDDHIMTRFMRDPDAIRELTKKHPGELVRSVIQSFGPMPAQRLQDRLAEIGLVKADAWKSFWESARRSLKADKAHPIEIPTKRTENIQLLEEEEDYGDKWLARFAKERDIKAIYEGVFAMLAAHKGQMPDGHRETVTARLNFALKGADKSDYPRYAQVAVLLRKLELSSPSEQQKQAATLIEKDEQDNLLLALRGLAARDVSALMGFLVEVMPESKATILEHVPVLNSVALGATLDVLSGDEEAGAVVRSLLARQTSPVPTLVVWALRNLKKAEAWQVTSLNDLVTQAIHIVEQRLTGEELKMRNALQAMFDSAKWLEEVTKELGSFERQVMFERIQASTSWETSSQRNILVRMSRFDAALAKLRRTVKTQEVRQHLTSLRSLTAFKLAYDHLINVEIPANTKDISTARSYGDLRENAEYQFAKDHQRVLLSKQDEMDRTLRMMHKTDFANVNYDAVEMGARVTVQSSAEGVVTYTILGELDRDEALNIISCRSRLAQALLGHKAGETVELPGENGTVVATITAIEPMDDAVKAWLAQIPTAYEPTV